MILIGTSGYSYEDWIGPFYPKGIPKGDMLRFYSQFFRFTEINFTYYQMPNPYVMNHLVNKTPEGFQFSVKVHQSMTHSRNTGEAEFQKFKESLKPLLESNKLVCLLMQFPYSFHYTKENVGYLCEMRERLNGFRVAVEFRNSKWISQATFDLLKDLDFSYVCVDEPDIKGLVEPIAVATNSIGYIRFHGRNQSKWYEHQQSYERYDYLYSEEELMEWLPRIQAVQKRTDKLLIVFNNHFKSQAVLNGRMMQALLGV